MTPEAALTSGIVSKRGTVWIAPSAFEIPSGRMVDPATSSFWVSWQDDDGVVADTDLVGAEAAISWGRQRSERVLIRLGHSAGTYFSAGRKREEGMPEWPPTEAPPDGWLAPREGDWRR
jgi:hypothetical protein